MSDIKSSVEFQNNKTQNHENNHHHHHPSETLDMELIKRFCTPLCSRDTAVREVALNVIEKTVEGWLDGYGSPKRLGSTDIEPGECYELETEDSGDIVIKQTKPNDYLSLVTFHLPAILRLSVSCPFQDVRDKFIKILHHIKVSACTLNKRIVSWPIKIYEYHFYLLSANLTD